MPAAQWPGMGLVRAELEHLPRREAFTADHPDTHFGRVGNVYLGHVPYTVNGQKYSITMGADSWPKLIDALEAYFNDDDEADTG